jgi:hypothetical protein
LIQDIFQKQRHSPLALPEAAHEQDRQGDESWSGLAVRHSRRKFGAGARPTTRADQSMPLVFRDQRLDLGNFPDLVPQRFRVTASERFTTPPTCLGFERDDGLTLLGGNQRPFVFGMSRLTAGLLAGRLALRRGLRVWMLRAGRQRRILGRLVDTRFQLRHPALQPRNRFRHLHKDRLGLRGNPIPKIRRHPVHAEGVVEIVKLEKINFPVASVQRVSAYFLRLPGE